MSNRIQAPKISIRSNYIFKVVCQIYFIMEFLMREEKIVN